MEWYEGIFEQIEQFADEENGRKMSAYMKDKFLFLGVPKPKLKECIRPYLKLRPKAAPDWDFVHKCYKKPYREAQYVAIEYLQLYKKKLTDLDFQKIKELIQTKSWWDTVDNMDSLAGEIILKYPVLKDRMREWSRSDNLWLRRVSIDFQQRYKEQTDCALLEEIICNNLGSNEFFINKAIGWSLREYGKTDPDWVRAFLEKHKEQLAPLSRKEASKHL